MAITVTPRRGIYIWPSWLAGVLSGEAMCTYRPWWLARHKVEDDDDAASERLQEYNARHAQMVRERASALRADGYHVTVEDQNYLTVTGEAATVGAKPDVVATDENEGLVSDAKGGRKRAEHAWQVRIYLALLKLEQAPRFDGLNMRGEVYYGPTDAEAVRITKRQEGQIYAAINALKVAEPPEAVPSARECRYCKVQDCDARHGGDSREASARGKF